MYILQQIATSTTVVHYGQHIFACLYSFSAVQLAAIMKWLFWYQREAVWGVRSLSVLWQAIGATAFFTHMWVLHQKLLPKSLGELSVCDAACLIFGHFSSPQAFTLTPASYSHRTSTSLHSICFIDPFHSFFKSFVVFFMSKRIFVVFTICKQYIFFFFVSAERFLQSTMQPHQSTKMALEWAASHIKVTRPPCLFWLPPWENVTRSTRT